MKYRRGVKLKFTQLLLGFGILLFTLLILDDRTHWRKKDGEKHTRNGRRVASISGESLNVAYGYNRSVENPTNMTNNTNSPKTNSPKINSPKTYSPKTNSSKTNSPKTNSKEPTHTYLNKVIHRNLPIPSLELPGRVMTLARLNAMNRSDPRRYKILKEAYKKTNINTLGRKLYNERVLILNTTLPDTWKLTTDLSSKLQLRREHVKNVCHERKLDIRSGTYQPNAWEFIVSDKHRLSWCNIFKAASSTWLYNFNILAGYTEKFLLKSKDTPLSLARKKYPRINVDRLDEIMNNGSYLSFMIARHPFDRLVSGYRDKIENYNLFYKAIQRQILIKYADIPGPKFDIKDPRSKGRKAVVPAPSFPQFVQYLIDSHLQGDVLNEHWIPMSTFCTPCLVNFDVYAKVESLNEDGNYIIFTSGIEKIIHPKFINRSKKGPTENVTKKFLCTLSDVQKKGLINLYQLDLELFEYDYKKYFDCDIDSI